MWTSREVRDYEARTSSWVKTWAMYDEPLRAICRSHPDHTKLDAVVAKVGLVQRAYQAGLERHVMRGNESAIVLVAQALLGQRKVIDAAIARLSGVGRGDRFDGQRLSTILEVHATLLAILCPLTRGGNIPRSFASKYLHFHCGAVPIYDERARRVLSNVEPWYGGRETWRRDDIATFTRPSSADGPYCRFGLQFLAMWNDASAAGASVTVRALDAYLITYAEEQRS
jgi:hypothetical protein